MNLYVVVKTDPFLNTTEEILFSGTEEECKKFDPRLESKGWLIENHRIIDIQKCVSNYKEILVITQASGFQLGEPNLVKLVPHNDLEFGKERVAKLNERTDLPFYLAKVTIGRPQEVKD